MQITPEMHKAAGEIIELVARNIGNEKREIHPGTAIASCARLAGSFLFRSFNFSIKDPKPGQVMLSNEANEKGPALINVLGGTLQNLGIKIDQEKAGASKRAEPNIPFLTSMEKLQDKAHAIMQQHKLTLEQMAYACAMSTAFIVKECRNQLPVESGFITAIYSFIEGTKTYPPELKN